MFETRYKIKNFQVKLWIELLQIISAIYKSFPYFKGININSAFYANSYLTFFAFIKFYTRIILDSARKNIAIYFYVFRNKADILVWWEFFLATQTILFPKQDRVKKEKEKEGWFFFCLDDPWIESSSIYCFNSEPDRDSGDPRVWNSHR